ncbi:hypothetical protein F3Y22_tig00110156pilonHSYRG00017 [Hibiscus syriacus]|uniref:Uncharacterized protein n=1 Tax=Hibiscus syriacus TaxID=106335 RepID=A0A6A3BH01_HIBSY|nr:hypothetical protein F3Y22_tig00110156pilonHSYRG00017 [Hibiscus syriacus]
MFGRVFLKYGMRYDKALFGILEFIIDKLSNTIVQRLAATIPPRQSCRMNALGWKWSVDRNFSVKSAYELRRGISNDVTHKVWEVISKYRGLQRIKFFLWLLANDQLLTNTERVRRHMATTSNYGICGQTGESSDHLFRQCYMAMAIWSTLVKTEKLEDFCTRDIRNWMQINIASPGFYAREENDWDLRFGSILWLIWKNRNSRIFDPDYFEHESVLEMSRRLTLEANRVMESSLSTIQLSHCSCTMPDVWQPPPHNWCKINIDGSCDIGSGFASCGGIIRSSNGGWMFGFSKAIEICSIVEAELWGIHEGLSHAWNLGERLITVETDSLEVVRMLKKNTKRGSISTLIDCVNELINRNWNVDLKHISRNANKEVDRLAKIAATRG